MTFCQLLGIRLKSGKTEKGHAVTFLGVFGEFPGPRNNMTLTISLPQEKALTWGSKLTEHLLRGTIQRKELESVVGKLSPTQTPIFGRIGRAMMATLFQKLNAKYYGAEISDREASVLRWWILALVNLTPRLTRMRGPLPGLIVYTDAATATQIIAAVLIDHRAFRAGRTLSAVLSKRVGPRWRVLFESTCAIYGLEMLAIFAILFDPLWGLTGLNITFFVDNNNDLQALVSNAPGPPVIAAMTQLIWYRIADLKAAVWFERALQPKILRTYQPTCKFPPFHHDTWLTSFALIGHSP